MRWAREGGGKSGGYRVIYFYHSLNMPLFALNVFAKKDKSNVTAAERRELKKLSATLVQSYGAKGADK